MNDPLQKAGFLPTAFTQAEGELRSKALFRREGITATSARSELLITVAGDRRLIRCLRQRVHPTIQRPKTIQSP
jgi:hypothetical protein